MILELPHRDPTARAVAELTVLYPQLSRTVLAPRE
jgi:hypothetical protein